MAVPRILLADDHALILGAIEKLLATDYDVVGQVNDGRSLLDAAEQLKPDVIVLDISMPHLNGLEAGRQIRQRRPEVRLIYMTMNEDSELAAEALRMGASGYLLKRSAVSELTTAIREVMKGRTYITPLIAEGLIGSLLRGEEQAPGETLTPRQRQVLQLLAEGYSMKQVASELDLSARTVAFHKYQMMEQLKVKSTAELIRYAVKHHIV